MSNANEGNKSELEKTLKKIDDSLNTVSNVLGKFGLDIITKIGQQNLKLSMVTDKIEELNKVTLDMKGLLPQLNNIIENQKILASELELVKSLIQGLKLPPSTVKSEVEGVGRDDSTIKGKEVVLMLFEDFKRKVDTANDVEGLSKNLEDLKTKTFEVLGGHRVLYEISQTVSKLNAEKTLTDSLKKQIRDKIAFWTNKI